MADALPNGGTNEREVIDPVVHLPVKIHDNTQEELEQIKPFSFSTENLTSQDHDSQAKSVLTDVMANVVRKEEESDWWKQSEAEAHEKTKMQVAFIAALAAGWGGSSSMIIGWLYKIAMGRSPRNFAWTDIILGTSLCCFSVVTAGCVLFFGLSKSENPKAKKAKQEAKEGAEDANTTSDEHHKSDSPESASWLNSLLYSLWPIVNPALFTSISDMLEDALQASLPKLIHGVKVADIGQGSEPLRILAIRGLPPGDASESKDGMQAEEGDFINLEVAVAYRSRPNSGTGLKARSKNAHLLMQFWAGGIVLPVWVELTGIIATARIRLQLTPNPPFLSTMTLTLLGQPKVALKCTPLAKNFFNVMDVPGLSGWLHRSIDAAIAEYVAPRSINLDLKTMLMGRDKMDTEAIGVIIVNVKSAKGFRDGDAIKMWKSKDKQSGDGYVTVGWGKWGKPMWSTRIIEQDPNPVWEEMTAILVMPADINAQERLKLQLWDSDRFTADDHLGTVELSLHEIMTSNDSHKKIALRHDNLRADDGSEWPGTLEWAVGYFPKITLRQHLSQSEENADEVISKMEEDADGKTREATEEEMEDHEEIKQLHQADMKEKSDEMIATSKPAVAWPSGILSIRIMQIGGLEIPTIRGSGVSGEEGEGESEDLPSPYCTIVINHQRIYKTRTKMKSNKPYYDAGTERFVKDWRSTVVMIVVRDQRLHEADPVLGVVVLPLHTLFKDRSLVTDTLPLIGGIGVGRLQYSIMFRNVQMKLPREILGWDVGTLEIQPDATGEIPEELKACRLVYRTLYAKGKMATQGDGHWREKKGRPIRLAVKKRYSSCLLIQFKRHNIGPDVTPAFCTLWLKDIPDQEDMDISVPIQKNEDHSFDRARFNATDQVGEHIGTLKMKLRFWPGLSGYHQNLADQDGSMAGVMEALDCAEESKEDGQDVLYDEVASSSSSDSESEDPKKKSDKERNEKDNRETGVVSEFKNYNKRKGELHRKHRGLMQWGAARNVAWMGRSVEEKADKVTNMVKGKLKHQQMDGGVEKEV